MTRPLNPYIAGKPVASGRGFFGRDEILSRIVHELRNPNRNHLILFGPRRIGKTSLLRQLERSLPSGTFVPVYFDVHEFSDAPLNRILGAMAESCLESQDEPFEEETTLSEQEFRKKFLPAFLKRIAPSRLVLLLDEFDCLEQIGRNVGEADSASPGLLPALQRVIERHDDVCVVVVAGRRIEDTSERFQAFSKGSLSLPVWTLKENEAIELIRQGETCGGLQFSVDSLSTILGLTGCHPYLTNLLCDRVWEMVASSASQHPVHVEIRDIIAAIPAALEGGSGGLNHWWNGIAKTDQVFAASIAESLAPPLQISEVELFDAAATRSQRIRTGRFSNAPDSLVRSWVLERVGDSFRFSIELFRQWIVREFPWTRAKKLLDDLDPVATVLFEQAEEHLRLGVFGQAIQGFRQVLSLERLHLGALLRLGEALLLNGEPMEAVHVLEQAYQLEATEAESGLKSALVALAAARAHDGRLDDALRVIMDLAKRFPNFVPPTSLSQLIADLANKESSGSTRAVSVQTQTTLEASEIGARTISSSHQAMRQTVEELFCRPDQSFGQYSNLDHGEELIPGLLFRFSLESPKRERVTLQIFTDLKGLGGQLWEQQARALVQISSMNHPAIPRIENGGYLEELNLAFVISRSGRYSLADEGGMAHLRSRPIEALRAFLHVTEALATLHGNGLLHRNLTPESLTLVDHAEPLQVCLSRFEMSVLLSNLLRRVTASHRSPHTEQVRAYYRGQEPSALLCHPPERLELVFSDPSTGSNTGAAGSSSRPPRRNTVEPPQSDLYSLGILAWQWFVGPPPSDLLRSAFDNGEWNRDAYESLQREMRSQLTKAGLPRPITELIGRLLDPDPRSRGTAYEAKKALQDAWMVLHDHWGTGQRARSLLIATLPEKFGEELRRRGKLDYDPTSEQGVAALLEYMQDDLRGSSLTFSERGYEPFARSSGNEDARKAQYVVVGAAHAYFCQIFEQRRPFGNHQPLPLPQVLLCKFTLEKRNFVPDDASIISRELPPLEPISMRSTRLDVSQLKEAYSWAPYLDSVKPTNQLSDWHLKLDEALTWLLQAQKAQLDSRLYAYTLEPGNVPSSVGAGSRIRLRLDRERDDARKHSDPLLSLFSNAAKRPEFGDFFKQLQEEEDLSELACYLDRHGEPVYQREKSIKVRFIRREDPAVISVVVEPAEKGSLPASGWLAPRLDILSRPQLQRQERALGELTHHIDLVDQLKKPRAVYRPFRGDLTKLSDLKGNAPEVIENILSLEPLYALHGPPGTGKTTVASRALEALLGRDRSARVLVTAQSHYALDNLADRLLGRINDMDLVAVRIFSEHAGDRVDPAMRRYAPEALASERIDRIRKYCNERLSRHADPPAVLKLLARWRDQADKSSVEIRDRLARGANLVFATCNVAARERVELSGEFDAFDLVIVEEAAKAWPTELLIPLVRGRRWLLIGDHRQLPAYQKNEIFSLLRACEGSHDERLRRVGAKSAEIEQVFDLFKQLFESPIAKADTRTLFRDPRDMLRLQFRMAPPIGELVSKAFYGGELETDPSTARDSGLTSPRLLQRQALLWLDTHDMKDNREAPTWYNNLEVKIVLDLLRQLRPLIGRKAVTGRLAILAPYREQVERLQRAIESGDASFSPLTDKLPTVLHHSGETERSSIGHFKDCVQTVDSFQGREADIVIISLTRFNDIDPDRSPRRRLGHMAAPERINVMLSRARQSLILIGAFKFFEESGAALEVQGEVHWAQICRAFTAQHAVHSASLILQDESARAAKGKKAGQKGGHH